ncbi:hypothetical protein ACFV8Z_48245 [Streptomyces sp. NPDC059837]|uniref:hypothetical protein n=1 Tax=Streptomyces sp. NPDC059837 TaxID=3346968 RepID=UPI00365A7889
MGTELLIKTPNARGDHLTRSLAPVVRKSMACARYDFCTPKDSSKGQLLEAKDNLQRMLATIPLTDEEQAAIDDGQAALSQLLDRLADVPTPSGLTPRQLLPIIEARHGNTPQA